MTGLVTISIRDHSNKLGSFSFEVPDITGATYDAQLALIDTVIAELAPITNGNIVKATWSQSLTTGADTIPNDGDSNKNTKARFFYQDSVNGRRYNLSVPSADYDQIADQGTNELRLAQADISDFVAALEAVQVSLSDNPVNYYRAAQASTATRTSIV